MLVLTRKEGDEVVCDLGDGRELLIIVKSCRGRHVQLGIEAPSDVLIERRERLDRRVRERELE